MKPQGVPADSIDSLVSMIKCIAMKPSFHLLIILAVGILVYANTFSAPFILDDEMYVVSNPVIRDFIYFSEPSKVAEVGIEPTLQYAFRTRVIGFFTFALNYRLHGLDVTGYHVFNLLIHLLNAFLVYSLVCVTFQTPYFSVCPKEGPALQGFVKSIPMAFFVAFLFVSHPVQTQAVTYITQRFASLATLFYLLAMILYIKSRLSEWRVAKLTSYVLSLLSAVFAMMTKEISFTLPVIVALYEFLFFRGTVKTRIRYLAPFVLTMLVIPLMLVKGQGTLADAGTLGKSMEILGNSYTVPRWDYFATQFRVIVTYLRLLLFPVHQNLDYDYPVYHSFFSYPVVLSFLFLLTLFGLGVYCLYYSRLRHQDSLPSYSYLTPYAMRLTAFGILWFFITLAVESSIIPIADVIFEHRVYLPSIGFFMALVAVISIMKARVDHLMPAAGKLILLILVVMAAVFPATAISRNSLWRDDVLFWQDVVEKSPAKARPHINLGNAYRKWGRFEDAFRQYEVSVELMPDNYIARSNLAVEYARQCRFDEALHQLRTTIQLNPAYPEAHYNLGNVYAELGQGEEAIRELKTAIRLRSYFPEAYGNLGVEYAKQGRFEEAVQTLQKAIQLKPDYSDAHYNLGNVYGNLKHFDDAIGEFEAVLFYNPSHEGAARNLEMTRSIKARQ